MNDFSDVEPDDELLTAYLDGELDGDERRKVQSRLVDDGGFRQRLAELQRAWDLLDELPETPVSQEFTRSTLELVVEKAAKSDVRYDASRDAIRWGWLRGMPLLMVLCSLGLIIGITGGMLWRWQHQRTELQELEVLANLSGLRVVQNMEVAHEFAKIPDLELAVERIRVISLRALPPVPRERSKRANWVASLDSQQKAQLWRNQQERVAIDPDDFQSWTAFSREVGEQPNAEKLSRALSVAGAVYEMQSAEEQASIVRLPPNDRAIRLKQLLYFAIGDWIKDQFTDRERQELVNWISQLIRREQASEPLPTGFRERIIRERGVPERAVEAIYREYLVNESEFLHSLTTLNDLPELAKNVLANVHRDSLPSILSLWVRSVPELKTPSLDELYAQYEKLDETNPARREALDLKPFAEMEKVLRQMYSQRARPRPGPRNGLGPPDRGPPQDRTPPERSFPDRGEPDRNSFR